MPWVGSRAPSAGLAALAGFFLFGAVMSGAAGIALLFPGSILEPLWRLNPQGRSALIALGPWAVVLMLVVCVACALSARGLWIRAPWGRRLAVSVLALNLVGDGANALLRGDLRTLVGLPIGAMLIAYLLSAHVRDQFEAARRQHRKS